MALFFSVTPSDSYLSSFRKQTQKIVFPFIFRCPFLGLWNLGRKNLHAYSVKSLNGITCQHSKQTNWKHNWSLYTYTHVLCICLYVAFDSMALVNVPRYTCVHTAMCMYVFVYVSETSNNKQSSNKSHCKRFSFRSNIIFMTLFVFFVYGKFKKIEEEKK